MSKDARAGPHRHQREARTSAHNFTVNKKPASLAFDVVPLSNGKPVWSTSREDLKVWQQRGDASQSQGLGMGWRLAGTPSRVGGTSNYQTQIKS